MLTAPSFTPAFHVVVYLFIQQISECYIRPGTQPIIRNLLLQRFDLWEGGDYNTASHVRLFLSGQLDPLLHQEFLYIVAIWLLSTNIRGSQPIFWVSWSSEKCTLSTGLFIWPSSSIWHIWPTTPFSHANPFPSSFLISPSPPFAPHCYSSPASPVGSFPRMTPQGSDPSPLLHHSTSSSDPCRCFSFLFHSK